MKNCPVCQRVLVKKTDKSLTCMFCGWKGKANTSELKTEALEKKTEKPKIETDPHKLAQQQLQNENSKLPQIVLLVAIGITFMGFLSSQMFKDSGTNKKNTEQSASPSAFAPTPTAETSATPPSDTTTSASGSPNAVVSPSVNPSASPSPVGTPSSSGSAGSSSSASPSPLSSASSASSDGSVSSSASPSAQAKEGFLVSPPPTQENAGTAPNTASGTSAPILSTIATTPPTAP
jgi:DNA-directed RNA polymerase subunit M/transcription elongation factor TFIIS